ncbi:hypothetical protein [Clostridium polynesiense]|uniref:hypothetical protein n=1 Tax=Clostridium polynesiense TaxID=1325933 RepID=UPI000AF547FF|nr:hypothetical protein [Clostridium polynesiense]
MGGVAVATLAAPLVLPALGAGMLYTAVMAAGTVVGGTIFAAMGASEISEGILGVNPTKNLANNSGMDDENYYFVYDMGVVLVTAGLSTLSPMRQNNKALMQNSNQKQKAATSMNKGAGKAPKTSSPDFVVTPNGDAIPVPKGATGPIDVKNPTGKTTGFAYTGGKSGANGQVSNVRIMDPTPPRGNSPGYPNGYVKYENKGLQGLDPITGKTIPNSQSHFPLK